MKPPSTGNKDLHQLLKSFSTNSAFMHECPCFSAPSSSTCSHQSIYINRLLLPYTISIIALDYSVFCFKLCY